MPSNLALNARMRADSAARAQMMSDAGLTPGVMAAIAEDNAKDYLLGEQRWDPKDVCGECFTARSKQGRCFCPADDDDDPAVLAAYLKGRS